MFFIQPPKKNASVKEWREWSEAERKRAIVEKRQKTMALEFEEKPEFLQESKYAKINGVYRQACNVGFVGSVDDNSIAIEPAQDATQEKDCVFADMESKRNKRGKSPSAKRNARKRKARKCKR